MAPSNTAAAASPTAASSTAASPSVSSAGVERTVSLALRPTPGDGQRPGPTDRHTVLLVGNPNAGKTTLFNALTGLRAKTANFPGTTLERRVGRLTLAGLAVDLIDLPGLYGMNAATAEERIARDMLLGSVPGQPAPSAVVLLIDATNLERNLYLASQVLELGLPTIAALNMIDLARRSHLRIDLDTLRDELNIPIVLVSARTGEGIDELRREIESLIDRLSTPTTPTTPTTKPGPSGPDSDHPLHTPQDSLTNHTNHAAPTAAISLSQFNPRLAARLSPSLRAACNCSGCPFTARFNWAEEVGRKATAGSAASSLQLTEKLDRFLTHPVVGVLAFFAVMFAVFAMIFWLASYPMDMIDGLFGTVGAFVSERMTALADWLRGDGPDAGLAYLLQHDLRSLLVEGVIGGVGGMLVFLPQICILFFFLSLLEDTGYLARAAFVMDRLMGRVGLPGKAFVPMLSAHACAIPAIMSARVIEDRRDRLVTILVLPLMSCSARIPVYAMVVALLFADRPLMAGATFTAAYSLGILAALVMAFAFKRSILPGRAKPLVMELPTYKLPSLRTALLVTLDRALIFVKNAGTAILLISVIFWALATYPQSDPPTDALALRQQAQTLASDGDRAAADDLLRQADTLTSRHALAHSFAGRLGHLIEPLIAPLGFDWQIGIGVVSSFAAREVIVSTLAVVYGVGADAADENPDTLYDTLRKAKRSDGITPVFNIPTSLALLVFYVLAMQCLPTNVVTRRETGSWKWPVLQFAYMTGLAYTGALITYQLAQTLMA